VSPDLTGRFTLRQDPCSPWAEDGNVECVFLEGGAKMPRVQRIALLLPAVLAALTLGSATAAGQAASKGQWSAPFPWPYVAIHMHVLPNGKVLTWSREDVGTPPGQGFARVRVWNPATGTFKNVSYTKTNLFCSGHSFLPDGRLLITGGRVDENIGPDDTTIFDYRTNTWAEAAPMNAGRWYPTNTTLPDGGVLVVSGSNELGDNDLPQIWAAGRWRNLTTAIYNMPWYPWMHVAPDGRVFNSGPKPWTKFLNTSGTGSWKRGETSNYGLREYGTSVMYAPGKVLIVGGGGQEEDGPPPTNTAEVIDLNVYPKVWRYTNPMSFARRQLNATILAEGKVLVTGGSSAAGHNNATGAVLAAEIWDPATEVWTTVASMSTRRLYHSTAVLLPDGRVLSAGGGRPAATGLTPPDTDHLDAEIYSPPYLFNANGSLAARPHITSAPRIVRYGAAMTIETPDADRISKVTWIRLSSVTHAFNMDQRLNYLGFSKSAGSLTVTAPGTPNVSPPGFYLLYVLNDAGVPSVAEIIRIR
jgi:Galactose oxidase-like, Early set domain/Glyoxal oxidase N-terminus